MSVPYHVHTFEIPVATKQDVAARVANDKVVTPSVLGTAAVEDISKFATAEQGRKADTAIQKTELHNLAFQDSITVDQIHTDGTLSKKKFLSGSGWQDLPDVQGTIANLDERILDMMVDGSIIMFPFSKPPYRTMVADGSLLSRKDYPILWEAISKMEGITTEEEWNNGAHGTFSSGDGSTTFRLPDVVGEFPRFWDTKGSVDPNRKIGSQQNDAIRNITGWFGKHVYDWQASLYEHDSAGGAFNGSKERISKIYNIASLPINDFPETQYPLNYVFDASRQVPTAKENRPRNISLLPCIRY